MSSVVGALLVIVGAVVLVGGAAVVSWVNLTERIPYPSDEDFARYGAADVVGFVTAFLGTAALRQEYSWWALVAGLAVFFVP